LRNFVYESIEKEYWFKEDTNEKVNVIQGHGDARLCYVEHPGARKLQ
jgi:hypothetical protein